MASQAPQAVRSRIRDVFMLQALLAAVLLVVGTVVGAAFLREGLLRERIRVESEHYWEVVAQDPDAAMPANGPYRVWFVPSGRQPDGVPPQLRVLAPGFHHAPDSEEIQYVGERANGRLYITLVPTLTNTVVRWMAALAIVFALIAIGTLAWLAHQRFVRMLVPLEHLAFAVDRWRLGQPLEGLEPSDLEPVAEIERLRASLVELTERSNRHIRRERDFTRDASHELRTPLTVIRMAGDILEGEDGLSKSGARAVQRVKSTARHMESLVEAFLVLAREPSVPLVNEEVDIASVLEECMQKATASLGGKAVALTLEVRSRARVQAPARVPGVIFDHLLQNACTFTDTGTIAVQLDAHTLAIRDTGIGMDAETLQRAFDPFFRADISSNTARGLGLSVVQRLVERMGWTIALDSQPGQGTQVTVRWD